MATDYEVSKGLRTAKILQVFFLAAIIIYPNLLYNIWSSNVVVPILPADDFLITILTMVLGIFTLCMIIAGYLLPRLVIKWIKQSKYNPLVLLVCRPALFEAIAIYGLILGLFSARWQIPLAFFVVAFVALILTFPTEARWKKIIELRNAEIHS